MITDTYVGNTYTHPELGKVIVDSKVENSRTKLNVTCIDRGEGWNEIKEIYVGVKTHGIDHEGKKTSTWKRGENKQYGFKDEVHYNTLN